MLRRGVSWKTGATIGFLAGTALGLLYLRGGGGEGAHIAMYYGVLGGLVGVLVEAMATSGT